MEEIHKLRAQISSIVQTNFPDVQTGFEANLRPPNALQLKVLRQLIAAGFIDHVAVRNIMGQGHPVGSVRVDRLKGELLRWETERRAALLKASLQPQETAVVLAAA